MAAAEELLSAAADLDQRAQSVRRSAIAGALNLGMSWDEIGAYFGTTGDATRVAYRRSAER